MHPYIVEQLASEHARELRTQADQSRLCTQAHVGGRRRTRPVPRNTVRHRAGWTLVEIGLRMAGSSSDG